MKKCLCCCMSLIALILCLCCGAETIANPVVPVEDAQAFSDTLGITFDDSLMYTEELEFSIISDTIGQVRFETINVNDETVEWTLRFTKDETLNGSVEMFAGIYDENLSEPVLIDYDFVEDGENTFTVTTIYAETENCTMRFFEKDGVYYVLTQKGDTSNMQFSEVFDGVFAACHIC